MAEVWKAFDPQLHRYVAIKLHSGMSRDPGAGSSYIFVGSSRQLSGGNAARELFRC